jgi:nicotinate dehydrogenase subunit B
MLPSRLEQYPDLDTWVRIDPADTVTVFTGKVELGQGIVTALARIASEELDVAFARVRVQTADTDNGLDEAFTAGSMSLAESGLALRQASAEARQHLLELAGERLGTAPASLEVVDGTIASPAGERTTYWELLGSRRFNRQATGRSTPKSIAERRVLGRREAVRNDLLGLVTGTTRFVQDMALEGMLHGRVVRPPGPGSRLASLAEGPIGATPGVVAVVRNGSFVGVVAEREHTAQSAADALRRAAGWTHDDALPSHMSPARWLLQQPAQSSLIEDGAVLEGPPPADDPPADATTTLKARYSRGYLLHGAIGPSAAVAVVDRGRLTIWSHTQGVFPLRRAIASVLGREVESVRVVHVPGPGCYGHNGADDAALDAALLAEAVPGRPVLLKWTRADEHQWEPYGPPGVVELQASLDHEGLIVDWRHDVWSTSHINRPGSVPNLLAAQHLDPPVEHPPPVPPRVPEVGAHRNALPIYELPRRRVVSHFVEAMPIRTSSLRSLGAYLNVFAIESFMDELADACRASRLEFRLRHLRDPRARAVLEAAAARSGWSGERSAEFGHGTGVGFARYKNAAGYAAVVVKARVDDSTAAVRVAEVLVVTDCGEIVDPSGLENQLEGGVIQALSWTLYESVTFDRRAITSVDWETYPIARFADVPQIQTVLIDRPGEPVLGAGEVVQGPTAAAVANAVRDALGVAVRAVPFTAERVRDAALAGS